MARARGELGGGPAGRLWARAELQRRWRALLVLGLLAGITCGVAAAAVAGARRSDRSWDRLRAVTNASDAIVFATQAGIDHPDWTPVVHLPYVEAAGAFGFGNMLEGDLIIDQYGDWLTRLDRPRIIEGRLPRPDQPLEVVAERPSAATDPGSPLFHVGQRVPVHLLDQEQVRAGPPPEGRVEGTPVTLHVVGIAESPFTMAAVPPTAGGLFAGPAFRRAYPQSVEDDFSNLVVRLKDPRRDISRLEADIARLFPGDGVPVYDLHNASKRVTNGTGLETMGLLLFALAVAAVGTVIVGQALTRSVRAAGGDLTALTAIGFDRAGAASALALPHLLSAITAVLTAVVTSIALSPRFPIGLGRRVDPDVGLHVDLLVVAGGAVLVGLLLTVAVSVAAWRTSTRARQLVEERPSVVVSTARRLGLPVTVVTGAGLALEPGRGHRTLPTRSALTGAAVGVLGLVGALVFLRGLDDAATHPERFGSAWDMEVSFEPTAPDQLATASAVLAKDHDISAVAQLGRLQAPLDGLVVPVYAIRATHGPAIRFVTLEGRTPLHRGEIVLGPDTAHRIHAAIGSTVRAADGARFRVVGIGLLPTTPHSSFDQGAWITPADVTQAIPMSVRRSLSDAFHSDLTNDQTFGFAYYGLGTTVARTRAGVDPGPVLRRVSKVLGPDFQVTPPAQSADQDSMHNVRSLPILFGIFAPLVALAALLHVSSSVLRRRGTDLAVLRAIGLTPRQAGACVTWQSALIALLGLIVGAPLGVVAGRITWRLVAEHTPMLAVIPTLTLGIVSVLPAVLLAAIVTGARPAWRISRLRTAEALRAE